MLGLFGKKDANQIANDKVRAALAKEGGGGGLAPRHVQPSEFLAASGVKKRSRDA